MIRQLTSLPGAAAVVPDVARGVVWIAHAGPPGLSSWQLDAERLTRHTTFAATPTGLALSNDRQSLIVACADGSVVLVSADDPDAGSTPLAAIPDALGQAAATAPLSGRGYALVVCKPRQQLLSARLPDGLIRKVADLDGISGVTAAAADMWAAATTVGEGRLVRVVSGAAQVLTAGLLPTGHVTRTADGEMLLIAHPASDRVTAFRFADGSVSTLATDDPAITGTLVEVHGLDDGRLLIVTDAGVALADALSDLRQRPRLVAPTEPLFVGSWIPLQYDLSGTGLDDDDISFVVADDPLAALISHTAYQGLPGARKVPLLIAGITVGTFTLNMVETATGRVLDHARFEVTDHWRDPDNGPSRMYAGDSGQPSAGDWGGGPGAPQNLGTQRHSGRWRLGVLLVDTTDGSFPTDPAGAPAARTSVLDEIQDGVVFNGVTRSARHYYEELSGWNAATGRGLTIQVRANRVFGPVALPEGWGTYFAQKKDASGAVIDTRWSSLGATVQTIVTRALAQSVLTTADLAAIDVLVMIPFSPDAPGTGTKRFVWPHAAASATVVVGPKASDQETFGWIFVPPDFATQDGRQLHTTVSHELGHTLGLPDLYNFPSYTPDVTNRLTGGWDMMAGSQDSLPHYTLSNRMRQGWVDARHLKLYNFRGVGQINETITLHAAELGTPAAGRFRGIEIRLADGWNVYIEYRAKQAAQVADTLPADRRVVVTDVTSDSFITTLSRPPIVFVHNDADGDGPILDLNADYEDVDPANQKRLVVTVVSKAADNAVVRIEYSAGGRADPGIRPWRGAPDWRSPDIEVRNAKSQADPGRWADTPWLGNMNTLVAKVRNSGDKLAKGVLVKFFGTVFSAGDGAWELLGTATRDIPPNATVEFTTPWVPTADVHYCVIVQIALYVDPDLAGAFETNIYNNEARTNYVRFVSASASPSMRVGAEVRLANPFDESTLVSAAVHQTNRLHRVYVDHQWLRVGARSARPIHVFDEALAGFPEVAELSPDLVEKELSVDNLISVQGWAQRPFPADCGAPTLTGGATVRVGAGRSVIVRIDHANFGSASGSVEFADGSGPVPGGRVLLSVAETDESGAIDPLGDSVTATAGLDDGRFATEYRRRLDAEYGLVVAHYLGTSGAAPADSDPKKLTT